ncbi:MAG: SDR family NAD(P)-dependent oxidoreductase [Candidatus Omnitrophica bacterium]|nr:SDR family NAD(P)-dependent oxidoreductase [Candidatus Omnitrophota bacterium]MBU1808966.1 SDR family NAD(P)-dependent oxidoreductase [Candidatus Omnitrophota bacterium]
MKLSGLNILVTGGAGFIGSHLVDALMSAGAQVSVFDNLSNGKLENLSRHEGNKSLKFIRGDINDDKALDAATKGIDVVFHLACLGVRHSIKHPLENHRVNAEGTLKLLEAAYRNKVKRFVYTSSSEVYGTAQHVPMKETHPTFPCTVYGAGKLAGEAYARAYYLTYGLKTVMVRPFNTYGPRSHHEGDAGELIPKSIVRAMNGESILVFGDGSQTRDFTYVEDMARGIIEAGACDKAVGLTLNIGSDSEMSINAVARAIIKIVDGPSKIENLGNRPGDVIRLYADTSELNKLTGWKPKVSFGDGLAKTVEYFKSRPEGPSVLLSQEKGMNWK